MTMTDDLVRSLNAACYLALVDGTNDYSTAMEAADRIEALTEDFALQVQRTDEQRAAYEQALSVMEADNARLREALTGIKRAAAHRMQDDKKDLHSYYFHTADAALNTGQEPSHE
jgi:hypothetical protein